jgi:hypothetical protein
MDQYEGDGRVNWRLAKELILKSYKVVALKRMITALEARARDGGSWDAG